MVKFLIVRFSSIGDIVLTTPVIRCLKKQLEGAEIHFLTKKQFFPVIKANPYIDRFYQLDNDLASLISILKKENYHYIIDLHHNLRTFRIKSRLRIMSFSFKKLNFKKWLLVNFKFNRLPDKHIVDRYFETIQLFDIQNDHAGLDYFIPIDEEIDLNSLPKPFVNGYLVLVVGARHFTKQLPDERVVEICNQVDFPVLLMGGEEDFEKAERIKSKCKATVLNVCGQYSINQSASLIKKASLVITPDTGLMHIAAAFRKKIISVWGNTVPEFGMSPYGADSDSAIFQTLGLTCRPCSKIGFAKCPKKHFKCMNNIDIEKVIQTTLNILEKK